MDKIINDLFESENFDSTDRALGGLMQRLDSRRDPCVLLAAALVSRATADGHVCIDLKEVCEKGIWISKNETLLEVEIPFDQWRKRLSESTTVGRPGDFAPLILDGHYLYLQRYWSYEQELANALKQRGQPEMNTPSPEMLKGLQRFLGASSVEQRKAAQLAASGFLTVISGGPGTGKTYTLARIILLLQYLSEDSTIRIKLAAPTGKAAAQLKEALQKALKHATENEQAMNAAADAQTIHRMLGIVPGKPRPRYHGDRYLPADVVVVDEASMIDLALMVRLVRAVAPETRLILTGDKDQLASVEAGAVLGDICYGVGLSKPITGDKTAAKPGDRGDSGFGRHIAVLQENFRFDAESGIGALSRTIKDGQGPAALSLLWDNALSDIQMIAASSILEIKSIMEKAIMDGYGPMFRSNDPIQALERARHFKILSPIRKGPFGVLALNHLAEHVLQRHGVIPLRYAESAEWYSGRPVMITQNDYFHELFNGDLGVAITSGTDTGHTTRVAFSALNGGIKLLATHQLPAHETVYALTVHKSQGSEFDHIFIVLPDHDLPILTRELMYTAVSRARKTLTILGSPELLIKAVARRTQRASGLRRALWS